MDIFPIFFFAKCSQINFRKSQEILGKFIEAFKNGKHWREPSGGRVKAFLNTESRGGVFEKILHIFDKNAIPRKISNLTVLKTNYISQFGRVLIPSNLIKSNDKSTSFFIPL